MATGFVPIYVVYPGHEVSKRHPIYAKPKTREDLFEQVCAEAKEMQVMSSAVDADAPVFDRTVRAVHSCSF
jgi:hypothetical protein